MIKAKDIVTPVTKPTNNVTPVTKVIGRPTASYQAFLDATEKPSAGRPRAHESNAAKQKAYRQRRQAKPDA